MKGVFFIGLILMLAVCTVAPDEGLSTRESKCHWSENNDSLIAAMEADSLAKVNSGLFQELLNKAVQQRLIGPEDEQAKRLVHRFFPNTSRYADYHVSIEPLALRDSFWLLLYEFIKDGSEKSQMFLGSFRKTGQVVDLLEMQAISFDGHISLSLLEKDILEIAYRDFAIKPDITAPEAYRDFKHAGILTKQTESSNHYDQAEYLTENSGQEYYRIHSNGAFEPLKKGSGKEITRMFPQASSRILSATELKQLMPQELQLMRDEIYASYGFTSESEALTNYFPKKDWYQSDSIFTSNWISDIEKLNLEMILNLVGAK